jgi:hypothetical protein
VQRTAADRHDVMHTRAHCYCHCCHASVVLHPRPAPHLTTTNTIILPLLSGLQPVLVHLSKNKAGGFSFNPLSVNLLTEVVKVMFALATLVALVWHAALLPHYCSLHMQTGTTHMHTHTAAAAAAAAPKARKAVQHGTPTLPLPPVLCARPSALNRCTALNCCAARNRCTA